MLSVMTTACLEKPVELGQAASEKPHPAFILLDEAESDLSWALISQHDTIMLQHDQGRVWWYIRDGGVAGEYVLRQLPADTTVKLDFSQEKITFLVQDQPVLTYQAGIRKPPGGLPEYYQRSGFIHPAYSPSGAVITDDFPTGHAHQHGIFAAWVRTEFNGQPVDFWNQQHQTGTVSFDSVADWRSGPVFAELKTVQQHIALRENDSTVVLSETWTIRVFNTADPYLWEIELLQTNISDLPLYLKPYLYGGMAFRGSKEWNDTLAAEGAMKTGPGEGGFRLSNGKDRLQGNHSHPEWVQMYGMTQGEPVSLTAFQQIHNPGYPQFVRVHPTMPYFCFTPYVKEGRTLRPGDSYRSLFYIMTANDTTRQLSEEYAKILSSDLSGN